MIFCPKCGALLKTRTDNKDKPEQYCSCGYTSVIKKERTIKESIEKKDEITIVDDKDKVNPLTNETCPKCKHDKARYWTRQTRSGDEPETKFFKCEKCKHVWREYD